MTDDYEGALMQPPPENLIAASLAFPKEGEEPNGLLLPQRCPIG
jgi:hypothetical protein